jgi:hypothetical protein
MAVLFPHRSTPELRYLQTKLGCKFSYQQAADILNDFTTSLVSITQNAFWLRNEISETIFNAEAGSRFVVTLIAVIVGRQKATRSKNQRRISDARSDQAGASSACHRVSRRIAENESRQDSAKGVARLGR